MSETKPEVNKPIDPFEPWRKMRDSYMEVWAKAMGETVNSEAYSQATGAMLESFFMTAPFREAQKKMMLSALEQLNMPSREEVLSLAERLSNLELLLDDMDNKLTTLLRFATENASKSNYPEPAQISSESAIHAAEQPLQSQPASQTETLNQVPEVDRSLPVEQSGDAKSEAELRTMPVPSESAPEGEQQEKKAS